MSPSRRDSLNAIERYMTLFNRAGYDSAAFDQMIDLFAEDAIVDITGTPHSGRPALVLLFHRCCDNIASSHHNWTTEHLPDGTVKVVWAAAIRTQNDTVHAFAGVEYYRFNENSLIQYLRNEPYGSLSPNDPSRARVT